MGGEEFKELSSRLEQVGKVLEKLPSEVREAAFKLMSDYIEGAEVASDTKERSAPKYDDDSSSKEFFYSFDHDKPADNVKLIVAYFYREYGTDPFTTKDINTAADDIGITVPARIDRTLNQASHNGKAMFTKTGKGFFKPTIHGEAFLKTTYSVRKGTKKWQRDS